MAKSLLVWLIFVAAACVSTGDGYGVHVILHAFSGRPNPEWYVSTANPAFPDLVRKLDAISSTRLPSFLGYSGFTCMYIKDGNQRTLDIGKCTNPDLELDLVDTTRTMRPYDKGGLEAVFTYVRKQIKKCGGKP